MERILGAVEDIRVGAAFRAARVRRRLRQVDIAAVAKVSDATVSRLERGHFETLTLRSIRAVAAVLELRIELLPRSRGADLDRLVNAHHATLAEQVIRWLDELGGWVVRPEVSFSRYGERGVIDVLAWHAATRSVLVIELKTDVVDVGELLGTLDRKLRNAFELSRSLGWQPASISGLLIISESDANRRRVTAHQATFTAAFPDRIVAVRRWLHAPAGSLRGLVFFSNRHPRQANARMTTTHRVRRSSEATVAARTRSMSA